MKLVVRNALPIASEMFELDSQGSEFGLSALASLGGGESRHGQYTGVKALMLAVLEEGIRNYLGPDGRQRSEAAYWIASPGRQSPFAFVTVCETLGLEPSAVRVALQRLREQNVSCREAVGRNRPNVRRPGRLLAQKVG